MNFDELLDGIREGRWLVPISIGILVVAVVVVLAVAWPQIKPKPRYQAQSLSTVVTQPAEKSSLDQADPVPEDAIKEIASALNIDDVSKASIHWTDSKEEAILVRVQQGALNWKEFTFVQKDGRWVRK